MTSRVIQCQVLLPCRINYRTVRQGLKYFFNWDHSWFLLLAIPLVVCGNFTNMAPMAMQAVVCDMTRGKGATKSAVQCK